VQPISWPAGSQLGALQDVSCVSASRCVAVGYRYDRTGLERPLIERLAGSGGWRFDSPPLRGHEGELDGVACVSGRACTAVGDFRDARGVELLVMRWDGRSWSLQRAVTPPGWTGGFNRVACISTRECVAVGTIGPSDAAYPLIERWAGGRWRIEQQQTLDPTPAFGQVDYLYGVSCSSTRACVAVGEAGVAGSCETLIERWNGAVWSSIAPPAARCVGILMAVSCLSATDCAAVGGEDVGSCDSEQDYWVPWVGRWDGRGWALEPTPRSDCGGSRDEGDQLTGLSCVSTRDCLAVGGPADSGTGAEIRRWNGRRWTIEPSPSRPRRGALLGVSCVTRTACVAVGYRGRIYGYAPASAPIVEVTARGPRA
jgi:hypothetical protein